MENKQVKTMSKTRERCITDCNVMLDLISQINIDKLSPVKRIRVESFKHNLRKGQTTLSRDFQDKVLKEIRSETSFINGLRTEQGLV
jgi:hypothetical protein